MSWSKKPFLILAAVLVILNVAGLAWIRYGLLQANERAVHVLSTVLEPRAEAADRVALVFDRPLVTEDRVGAVEESPLFSLEPTWPGKWVWLDRDRLEFQGDRPLPAGRIFHAVSTAAFETRTGQTLATGTNIVIQTAPLAVERCEILSADDTDLTVELVFNQPVDCGDLLRHLRAYDASSNQPVNVERCLGDNAAKRQLVRMARPASGELRLELAAALTGAGAEVAMTSPLSRTISVPRDFAFLSAQADVTDLEEVARVRMHFTRTLDAAQKLPTPTIVPPLEKFEVHRNDDDLVVSGNFVCGQTYRLTVPGTLLDKSGKTLGKDASATVEIPVRGREIEIPQAMGILSPGGNLMLDAKVVNVPGLKFTAYRVHENNLVAHINGEYPAQTARPLGEKTVKLALAPNVPQKIAIDLKGVVGDKRGIYCLTAQSSDSSWPSVRAIVAVTDLGITAKHGFGNLSVWVTSLQTGRPVAGAEIKAVSHNNQTLASGKTDDRGLATISMPLHPPDGEAWIVTAEKDGDLSCLRLDDNQWMMDDVDQSGRAYPETYEVMLYSDRGVYRPGETVNLTGIVRDRTGHIPAAFPLTIKVTRPDGRVTAELAARHEPDRQGVFHVEFATREDGQTGPYTFEATLPGGKESLGSAQALVEAFVPARMEVKAIMSAQRYTSADTPKLATSARYLWDQPAAGVPVAVEGALAPMAYESQKFKGFHFGKIQLDKKRLPLPRTENSLDDAGKLDLPLELPNDLPAGLYRMAVAATVTEPGGRSVSASAVATLDRLGRHIGLRLADGAIVAAAAPITINWVRLAGDDTPAPAGDMDMRLDRVQFDTVVKRIGGRYIWESIERLDKIETRDMKADAADGKLDVTCPEAGVYRLTLKDRATGSTSELDFYVAERDSGAQNMAMNRPERLEVVVNKEKFLPGDSAKVLVRSPIPGTLLLTLETDRVVWSHVAQIEKNTADVDVPLPADLRGGAFLVASVVRAVDPSKTSWLPHRAMGMARVRIDNGPQRLPLTIAATTKARPGETVKVTVETGGAPANPERPAIVHLWAVDEGILLTAGYRTPDAEAFFLNPRSPGLSTSDLFFALLPDYKRPEGMTRIGADGGEEQAFSIDRLRRNPTETRRRPPAIVWRTAAPVDKDGRLTVDLKMPDLTGQMRLMAVAVEGDRYARAEHALTLTTPMVVEASWPRFVAPGDTFEVPVKIFNATDKPVTVRAAVKLTGPVQVATDASLDRITVKPGQPVTHFLKAKATGLGAVEATVEIEPVDGGDASLKAVSSATFPVRPATALHSEVKLVALVAGEKMSVPVPDTFIKGTARMTVEFSPDRSVQLAPALEQLVHYPYGCVEQTSSRLFALIYAPKILGPERSDEIKSMVQAGISRLWSMQTRSGGLGYWPGDNSPCLWGTAYASTCLLEAKAAGYEIDPRFTQELAKYMAAELIDRRGSRPDSETGDGGLDNNTRALICRVLAVFGDPPHGWMGRLAEQPDTLDTAGRAHLAVAFMAAGRKDRAMALLPTTLPAKSTLTTTDGRLTSPIRQDAVLLAALLEIDPKNALVGPLASRLEQARRNSSWGSTLENASALAALARYQAATGGEKFEFSGSVTTGTASPLVFDHTKSAERVFDLVTAPLEITTTGTGTIYGSVATEGLAEKGVVKPYSRELKINRRWVDAKGRVVNPQTLHVGDLVRVILSVTAPRDVKNVAIVEALPGGLEVENPALATSAAEEATAPAEAPDEDSDTPSPIQQARNAGRSFDKPDHVEFLDDRVVLFTRAGPKTLTYCYALRVTAAGEFDLPPIQASCMYDPNVAFLGAEGRVKTTK
jgi:alpha-2-macroglobulin